MRLGHDTPAISLILLSRDQTSLTLEDSPYLFILCSLILREYSSELFTSASLCMNPPMCRRLDLYSSFKGLTGLT